MSIACPRCGEPFNPSFSAGSRAVPERDIDICGPCGTDEAVGRGPVAFAAWPLGPNPVVHQEGA